MYKLLLASGLGVVVVGYGSRKIPLNNVAMHLNIIITRVSALRDPNDLGTEYTYTVCL